MRSFEQFGRSELMEERLSGLSFDELKRSEFLDNLDKLAQNSARKRDSRGKLEYLN